MATHKRHHLSKRPNDNNVSFRRAQMWAVMVVLALVLAACGNDGFGSRGRLDATKLESQIERALLKGDTFGGVVVSCPDDVQAKSGADFTCDANLPDGSTISIAVSQVDDKGSVEWHAQNVVTASELQLLEEQIGKEIASQLDTKVRMDCGDEPAVITDDLECEATLGTGTVLTVALSIDPDTGNIKWESEGGQAQPPSTESPESTASGDNGSTTTTQVSSGAPGEANPTGSSGTGAQDASTTTTTQPAQ